MTPTALELELTRFYELILPLSVESVVISNPALVDGWLPQTTRRPAEQLLVHSQGDEAAIALFLAEDVLHCLAHDDPRVSLHEGNLQAFLYALEGVSHFVCLAWHAQFDREISALELELQAELDKFILSHILLERQGRPDPAGLIKRLFDSVHYDPALSDLERWRYMMANTYARQYCRQLAPRLTSLAKRDALQRELRRFYRLDAAHKLSYIGND